MPEMPERAQGAEGAGPAPAGRSRHGTLTLDQLAELQPGLGRLMPEASDAYFAAFYAAKGGNFALARYMVRKIKSLFRMGAMTRPKYAKLLEAFIAGQLDPLEAAAEACDPAAFEALFGRATEVANRMHAETGHPEIRWRLPPEPPRHLDLGPVPSEPRR